VWSAGLRSLLLDNEEEKTDIELAQEQQPEEEQVLLGQLNHEQWRTVLAHDARGTLLEVARTGEWQRVIAFLSDIGVDCGPSPPLGYDYQNGFRYLSRPETAALTK
jgi:hypothetical protein